MNILSYLDNVHRGTWFHKLDPRVKILFLASFTITDMIFLDPTVLIVLLLTLVPIGISARVRLRDVWVPIAGYSVFLISITIVQGFAQPGNQLHTILQIGAARMTQEGLWAGLVRSLRIANPFIMGLLFITTTDPTIFARGLVRLKVPLEFAFTMLAGIRFFPLIVTEAQNILDAQIVRGIRGGRYTRFKLLLFPLFLNSLIQARNLGATVECKAFGARGWKEFLHDLRLRWPDFAMTGYCMAMLAVAFYVRFVLGYGWAVTANPF